MDPGFGGFDGVNVRQLCLEIIALSFAEVLVLPCWQLQELADINTEAKLLLLIITFVCVREKEMLSGQREEKGTGNQRGWNSECSRTELACPWALL